MSGADVYNINVDDLAADVIPVVKEGYLKKKKTKGVRFGRTIWNSRYFQVNNVERALIYSKTEESPPLKKIAFQAIVSCKMDVDDKNNKRSKRRFRLVTKADGGDQYDENPYRKYYFEAESPSEAEDWVKCLHELSIEYIEKKRKREKIIMKARMSTIPYNPNASPVRTRDKLIPNNMKKSDDNRMNRTASSVAIEAEFDDDGGKNSNVGKSGKCLCCVLQ
eukprot:g6900.t1